MAATVRVEELGGQPVHAVRVRPAPLTARDRLGRRGEPDAGRLAAYDDVVARTRSDDPFAAAARAGAPPPAAQVDALRTRP